MVFLLLIRTHRSVKVANDHLVLKWGRRVTREVTLQTPTSCALRWHKLDW
jgi:hypothetical protein